MGKHYYLESLRLLGSFPWCQFCLQRKMAAISLFFCICLSGSVFNMVIYYAIVGLLWLALAPDLFPQSEMELVPESYWLRMFRWTLQAQWHMLVIPTLGCLRLRSPPSTRPPEQNFINSNKIECWSDGVRQANLAVVRRLKNERVGERAQQLRATGYSSIAPRFNPQHPQ